MSQNFAVYTEISANAYHFNPKKSEVIERKKEIVNAISQHYGSAPLSALFYGFSPLILSGFFKQISVTYLTEEIKNLLDSLAIKYTHVKEEQLSAMKKKFNWVVASDEFFTFAESEQDQQAKVHQACELANELMITTLRDYKNQDYKDKEFSQPLCLRSPNKNKIFLEFNDYTLNDRNHWTTQVYELEPKNALYHGPFSRRTMYFKQLAKFSMDAGAKGFYVHKNLMYKSLIKKNYEHVISIGL